MKSKILFGVLALLLAIQFFRPAKNLGSGLGESANDITVLYPTPSNVKATLEHACYDCHSDRTRYPWYAEIQPVGWWLANHVKDGKRHLNFSAFGTYEAKRAARKMKQTIEEIRDEEMPLSSYTLIHHDARLSNEDRSALEAWAQAIQEQANARAAAPSAGTTP